MFWSKGDWTNAINGYWSPLYPFILGMAIKFFNPALSDQLFMARIVNIIILVGLMFSFDFFLKQFIDFYNDRFKKHGQSFHIYENSIQDKQGAGAETTGRLLITKSQWQAIGGCLFAWLFLSVGAVKQTTPDYLVATSMFAATAIVLQIYRAPDLWRFALLGAVLGLGYLSKASMIPMAVTLVMLASVQSFPRQSLEVLGESNESQPPDRKHSDFSLSKRLCGFAIAFAVMVAVSAPYVQTLAEKKGRFEISSSAGLNYMILIACKYRPLGPNAPDVIEGCRHPIQTLWQEPNLAFFDRDLNVTYPPWFDPSYFADGLKVEIDPVASVVSMITNMVALYLFFGWPIIVAWLSGWLVSRRLVVNQNELVDYAILWLPSLMTIVGISCVINLIIGWTTQRYFPPMVILLYFAYFAVCNFQNNQRGQKALKFSIGIICGASLILLATRFTGDVSRRLLEPSRNESLHVATALLDAGLNPGDKVAMIGDEGVEWARIGQFKIVAQGSSSGDKNDLESENSVGIILQKLKQTTASAVVYFPEPFSKYVIDEAVQAHAFQNFVAKLAGGNSVVSKKLQMPPSSLNSWKKLQGVNAYVLKL
ncbi:MAG: hypothetical protein SGJ27_07700 [Candidatus Melainabacteria bacterium]|nr:hypothetical protein [Candidatus Melainabacteria bacterium]